MLKLKWMALVLCLLCMALPFALAEDVAAAPVDDAVPETEYAIGGEEETFDFFENGEMIETDIVSNDGDFEMDGTFLIKYNGPGGDVIIPEGVTVIAMNAFCDCNGLTSISIPESVKIIGEAAFSGCSNLNNVIIPNSVTSIGQNAFSYCSAITTITIPGSVTNIGDSAFYMCTNLSNITISNGIERIGALAFYCCEKIVSITIPSSVTSIGYSAFLSCTSLSNIVIPDSVTSIGDSAFSECTGLLSLTLSSNIKSIDFRTFSKCSSLNSITIPNGVEYIDEKAFYGCYHITDVAIESDDIYIYDDAFSDCYSLETFHTHCETPATKWAREHGYMVIATEHKPVTDEAVPATYDSTGLTEGSHCSVCGEILVEQEIIPVLGPTIVSEGIEISGTQTGVLNVKESVQLTAMDLTAAAPLKKGKWTTSDRKIATVTSKGKVTGKGAGVAVIKVASGELWATIEITVKDLSAPTGISLSGGTDPVVIDLKKSVKLSADVTTGGGAFRGKLKWSTDNKKVATVSNGRVTGKSAGTATITVETPNGFKDSVDVVVRDQSAPTSLSISPASVGPLKVKQSVKLTASMDSENHKPKTRLKWTTDNKKVATVSNGRVTAKGPGTATITVTTANGLSASIVITVE